MKELTKDDLDVRDPDFMDKFKVVCEKAPMGSIELMLYVGIKQILEAVEKNK